jgi:hypothetical protein
MTLCPIQYLQPDNNEKYVFKTEKSQINFLQCLNVIENDNFEEKRKEIISLIIWEPFLSMFTRNCWRFCKRWKQRLSMTKMNLHF